MSYLIWPLQAFRSCCCFAVKTCQGTKFISTNALQVEGLERLDFHEEDAGSGSPANNDMLQIQPLQFAQSPAGIRDHPHAHVGGYDNHRPRAAPPVLASTEVACNFPYDNYAC